MTPEEQRITIAELDGYKWFPTPLVYPKMVLARNETEASSVILGCVPYSLTPNYPSDPNAIHKVLGQLTERQKEIYVHALQYVVWSFEWNDECSLPKEDDSVGYIEMPARASFNFANATSAQCCEAYLRTIGKWERIKV